MSNELKNKLDQEPLEFDTSMAWEQLSPKLESSKRKRRGLIWWWISGGLGLVVLAAIALFLFNQTPLPIESKQAQVKTANEAFPSLENTVEQRTDATGTREVIGEIQNADKLVAASLGDGTVASIQGQAKRRGDLSQQSKTSGLGTIKVSEKVEDGLAKQVGKVNRDAVIGYSDASFDSDGLYHAKSELFVDSAREARQPTTAIIDEGELESAPGLLFENSSNTNVNLAVQEMSPIPFLGLAVILSEEDLQLGPLPEVGPIVKHEVNIPTPQFWQIGLVAGVGKDFISSKSGSSPIRGRTTLETRSLQLSVTRAITNRLAISAHAHLLQRHELYQNRLFTQFNENVFNPEVLLVGGERYGDSVTVVSELLTESTRYATLTRLNIGATLEYLLPTQFCEFAFYGGANLRVIQHWKGSRFVQPEDFSAIVEDQNGPYSRGTKVGDMLSYVVGVRLSKPLGTNLHLLLDSRAVLNSMNNIESSYGELGSESFSIYTGSLGLGWRF